MHLRKLDVDDFAQGRALSTEAFGGPPPGSTAPAVPAAVRPGRHQWGTFDGDRLVAKVVAHEYRSWWRGNEVPTCGIAGVAVAAEHRGSGLLRGLFDVVLAEARERGEVISTLYPTATGIYRPLGYELITSYDTVEIPTAELARIRAPHGVSTRRATVADRPALRELYAAWASLQNGPLSRTGPLFDATHEEALDQAREVTLAVGRDGEVLGSMTWERNAAYGPDGVLVVHDLHALDPDAYRALWLVAASFASVTSTVRLWTSGADPARYALPSMAWDVTARHPYMLRVLDVPGAIEAFDPRLPGGGAAEVDLHVSDPMDQTAGSCRLSLGSDHARCEARRHDEGQSVAALTSQGLALVLTGAQSCGNLRALGHLAGGDEHDAVLDAAFGGRQLHVRDYF